MTSTIRWFSRRGFGFIADPNGGQDIFFHSKDLRCRQDLEDADGQEVEFELVDNDGRPAATDVFLPHRPVINIVPYVTGAHYTGTVKFMKPDGGWGYILCADHDDIHFRKADCRDWHAFRRGDEVSFIASYDGEHHNARQVSLLAHKLAPTPPSTYMRPRRRTSTTTTGSPQQQVETSKSQPSPADQHPLDPALREELYGRQHDYPAGKSRKGDKPDKKTKKGGRT